MAHITAVAIDDIKHIGEEALQLHWEVFIHPIKRTGSHTDPVLSNAWFEGKFSIPTQNAALKITNDKPGQLDPQAWLDALGIQVNTSDLPLMEPTITIPEGTTVEATSNTIEGTMLKVTPSVTGDSITAASRDLVQIGDPKRTYRIIEIVGTVWTVVPGIMPIGTNPSITSVSSIKFEITRRDMVLRTGATRQGISVDWREVIQ